MPTRYSLDVDFKGVVSADVIDNKTKKEAEEGALGSMNRSAVVVRLAPS